MSTKLEEANLTTEQMVTGIKRLEKLISEIQNLNIQAIQKRFSSEAKALESSIQATLGSVFGHGTIEYRRYEAATKLDNGPLVMRSPTWGRLHDDASDTQRYLQDGRDRSIQLLQAAIKWLRDELDFKGGKITQTLNEHSFIHPAIQEKCEALYNSKNYAEAVERSFKIVRDRLRDLTTHETGSEAFGKGKLHIKGAAAANVEFDFNEGVRFLTMAIDKFRNEKSHTSDANIADPARAQQYLALSSLAMSLLEGAEIKP